MTTFIVATIALAAGYAAGVFTWPILRARLAAFAARIGGFLPGQS
jgi:hypothetical protein